MNQEVTELSREGRPVVYGEVLFDSFPDGATVLGGAPFNVAWHLQGFGQRPLLISSVGRDSRGDTVLQTMSDWGMDTQGVQIDSTHPTGAVNVSLSNGQPTFNIVPEQAYDFIGSNHVRNIIDQTRVSLLYHGSLAARSKTSHDALLLLRAATKKPVFVDINLRTPWWDSTITDELIKQANWLKLNDVELITLTADDNNLQALQHAASIIFKRYQLELMIVTCGEKGGFIISKDGVVEGQPFPVKKVIDTVGAGDAFSSVMLLGLLEGWPLADVLQRALQFASMICGVRGAIIRDKALYQQMLNQWRQSNE